MPTIVEQAGAIPFTILDGHPKILLVRAKHEPDKWIFPKGHIEPGENAQTAAVRELEEEGGVKGRALRHVGTNEFQSGDEHVKVKYFLVNYDGEPRGGDERDRATFDVEAAITTLGHEDARKLLKSVRHEIERYSRQSR